jgi:hypothetical protein
MNFDILVISLNLLRKFKFHSNLTRITGTLYEDLMYNYGDISPISSQNEKCVGQKLQRKSKRTLYVP